MKALFSLPFTSVSMRVCVIHVLLFRIWLSVCSDTRIAPLNHI